MDAYVHASESQKVPAQRSGNSEGSVVGFGSDLALAWRVNAADPARTTTKTTINAKIAPPTSKGDGAPWLQTGQMVALGASQT